MKKNFVPAIIITVAMALTGCTATTPTEADQPSAQTPDVEPAVSLNAHGMIDTEVGDSIIIKFPGTDKTAVEFTVTQIDRDVQCTEQFAIPPQNGEFIGLVIEATTADDYMSVSGNEPMRFFRNDFYSAISTDSDLTEAGSGTGCIGDEFPLDVPAGKTVTGRVMLDLPPTTTSIVWEPSTFVIDVPGREWVLD